MVLCNFCAAKAADTFVKQYYLVLKRCPENLYKFYDEPSLLGRPGPDGVLEHSTTIREINEKIMSPDYKYCSVEIKTVDGQITINRAFIVVVTGCLVGNDNVKRNFSQTFILAKEGSIYYVLNDILRYIYMCETTIGTGSNSSDDENDQPTHTQNAAPSNMNLENGKDEEATVDDHAIPEDTPASDVVATTISITSCQKIVAPKINAGEQIVVATTTNSKVASAPWNMNLENGKDEEATVDDHAFPEDTPASDVVATTLSIDSCEKIVAPKINAGEQIVVATTTNSKVSSVFARSKKAKVASVDRLTNKVKGPSIVEPTTNVNAPIIFEAATTPSIVALETNTKEQLVIAPTNDSLVLSTITPASNVTKKFSYAYVLAKEDPMVTLKDATNSLNVHKQTLTSPSAKTSVSSPKASNFSGNVSKTCTSSRKVAPESPTSSQCAVNASPRAEGKGVYIGGLPYNITKKEVVDVVKVFGPVRRNSDTIQIMRSHEDGFCFGFVEFESEDAAHRAIEAHHVMFGETQAYITYKRSSSDRGYNKGGTRGRNRNENVKG